MNSNREPDQGELVEDSMFILPDNHAQQQNENENANYPRNIANQVVDNLRQRSYRVNYNLTNSNRTCSSEGALRWDFYALYLFINLIFGNLNSNFGIYWLIVYALFGNWTKRSEGIVLIGSCIGLGFLFWAIKQGFGDDPLPHELKVYFLLVFLGLVEFILVVLLILILIVIILVVLALLFLLGGIGYFVNKTKILFSRRKRDRLFSEMNINEIENTENEECSICLEVEGKICRFQCAHAFHKDCIKKWLQSNKTCPVCRNQLY